MYHSVSLYLAVYLYVESKVIEVEQTLGSLAMEAVTLLLTAINSNAGNNSQSLIVITVKTGYNVYFFI